jgi:hypothetical protein
MVAEVTSDLLLHFLVSTVMVAATTTVICSFAPTVSVASTTLVCTTCASLVGVVPPALVVGVRRSSVIVWVRLVVFF